MAGVYGYDDDERRRRTSGARKATPLRGKRIEPWASTEVAGPRIAAELQEAPPSERRDVERRPRSLEHLARYDGPKTEKYSQAAPKRISISAADRRKVLRVVTREKAQKLYPMYDRFKDVRKKLDPKVIVANGLIRDLFG